MRPSPTIPSLRPPSRRPKRSSPFGPIAAPHKPVAFGDPSFDSEDQGQSNVRCIIGHDIRGIRYRDAARPGSGDIDQYRPRYQRRR